MRATSPDHQTSRRDEPSPPVDRQRWRRFGSTKTCAMLGASPILRVVVDFRSGRHERTKRGKKGVKMTALPVNVVLH
jgi:hypothetical protein